MQNTLTAEYHDRLREYPLTLQQAAIGAIELFNRDRDDLASFRNVLVHIGFDLRLVVSLNHRKVLRPENSYELELLLTLLRSATGANEVELEYGCWRCDRAIVTWDYARSQWVIQGADR
jgi:hypothetical protein